MGIFGSLRAVHWYKEAVQFELPFGLGSAERREPAGEWLAVGSRRVPLRLVRNLRARRYVLRLARDGAARLTIPRGGSAREGRQFAERNLVWLEQQLLRRAAEPVPSTMWADGTEILFRGEMVRLELRRQNGEGGRHDLGNGGAGEVCFAGEVVPVRETDADLRPAVEQYLRRLATQELTARVWELAAMHQFSVQRVSVRNQRSRWGSCSRRGTLSLNWRLVQTPVFVRDYLIFHELAHLKEMNHSKRFWREVERLCPDFAPAERWLKQHAELLR